MQLPIISRRGQNKPYGSIPRINWAHPLARGLVFYHYDAGGVLIPDLASNLAASQRATPLGRASSAWGETYLSTSANITDGVKYTITAAQALTLFTAAVGYYKTATSTEDTCIFFGQLNAALNAVDWGIADNASNLGYTDFINSSAATGVVRATQSVNAYHSFIINQRVANTVLGWSDGVALPTDGAFNVTGPAAGHVFSLHSDGGGPNAFQGGVFWAAQWNRDFTDAEARQLHLDPYCFLIYPEDEMFSMLVASSSVLLYLRPDADSIDGGWTNELGGTTLFSSIDETVASDTDYIQSSINPVADIAKISLSNPASTVVGPAKLRYRYKKDSTTTVNVTVRLLQGLTEIASWTHTGISSSYVTTEQTLTAPQLASITDFTDLYIVLEANV